MGAVGRVLVQRVALFVYPVEPVSDLVYTERSLGYGEKILYPFQKLKAAGKDPSFTLKHILDIESPLAIAEREASRSDKKKNDTAGAYLLFPRLLLA